MLVMDRGKRGSLDLARREANQLAHQLASQMCIVALWQHFALRKLWSKWQEESEAMKEEREAQAACPRSMDHERAAPRCHQQMEDDAEWHAWARPVGLEANVAAMKKRREAKAAAMKERREAPARCHSCRSVQCTCGLFMVRATQFTISKLGERIFPMEEAQETEGYASTSTAKAKSAGEE
jgi:hypothetical protein